jgi:hypothetical protein
LNASRKYALIMGTIGIRIHYSPVNAQTFGEDKRKLDIIFTFSTIRKPDARVDACAGSVGLQVSGNQTYTQQTI